MYRVRELSGKGNCAWSLASGLMTGMLQFASQLNKPYRPVFCLNEPGLMSIGLEQWRKDQSVALCLTEEFLLGHATRHLACSPVQWLWRAVHLQQHDLLITRAIVQELAGKGSAVQPTRSPSQPAGRRQLTAEEEELDILSCYCGQRAKYWCCKQGKHAGRCDAAPRLAPIMCWLPDLIALCAGTSSPAPASRFCAMTTCTRWAFRMLRVLLQIHTHGAC